jgi:putative CocE/NonD family hydrolase
MSKMRAPSVFSTKWQTSGRDYGVIVEHNVRIPMKDGITLSCDVFRPDGPGRFPAILGLHPYSNPGNTGPIKPKTMSAAGKPAVGQDTTSGALEAGDPQFFARRGYVHVVCNVRGTGKSEGKWVAVGRQEQKDGYEVVEWAAVQPWCNGNVGMFGPSYFGFIQLYVASLQPPHLKCIFAPWAASDMYRDRSWRGGILGYGFPIGWARTALVWGNARPESISRLEMGEEAFRKAVASALQNDDLRLNAQLADILRNPDTGINPYIVDILLHPNYDSFWKERTVNYEGIKVPAYIGASWGMFGLHLPGAFRSWEKLKGFKKMMIGPVEYLDRPVYQLHHEALRWFDHWLKGVDTGMMKEPPIQLFVQGTGEWKNAHEWPLPETRFTPFFLHEDGLLSEHEFWPNEGSDSFEDSPWGRGAVKYVTPAMVENTEVMGPITLKLYASTTDDDIFWLVSLWQIDPDGKETLLTKGWLRGSHRKIDPAKSKPWLPYHPHGEPEPLVPNQVYDFEIGMVPIGSLFKAGTRIALKISCVDDEPKSPLENIAAGNLRRQSPSRITVFRNAEFPSHVLLPVTKGNILGTFMSGGSRPS